MITGLALLFVAFVWGATFVLVKSALDDVSPLAFLAVRFTLAGAVLAVTYQRRLSASYGIGGRRLTGGIVAGFFLFGGYAFQTFGLRWTTPSKSAFLTGLAIVMVPLLSSLVYRITPTISEGAGVVVAAAGMALMTLGGSDLAAQPGDLLTLAGALFFGMHIVAVGHYSRQDGFERLSVLQISTAAVLAVSTFWWVEDPILRWTPPVIVALLVTGLLATAAAFTIQAWAQQHTSATRTALIFAMEPVFAWITSYLVLGEVLTLRTGIGAALILAGILTVELKPGTLLKHPKK